MHGSDKLRLSEDEQELPGGVGYELIGANVLQHVDSVLGEQELMNREDHLGIGVGEGVEFRAIAAAVLGGTSLFGGVGSVFPGTVIGVVLVQMISTGLVFLQIDIWIQDMVAASVIFFAVLIDALRRRLLTRLERRNIRVEKGPSDIAAAVAPP